jgi:imidazolonepropionase
MQMVLSLACTEMRMSPAEAITAATINGAHALRIADRTGSLEPGKYADLLVLSVNDYRELPYYFGTNNVNLTIKGGAGLQACGRRPRRPASQNKP